MHYNKSKILFLFSVLLISIISIPSFYAHAVFLSPNRLIFEDKTRAQRLLIHNNTNQAHKISFEWDRLYMSEGGKIIKLKEGETYPGYSPVDPYIKYSPRQTILRPGESQNVRLLVQKPSDLPDGEYRSHFKVKSDPILTDTEKTPSVNNEDGAKFAVVTKISKGVPIFLRQGQTTVNLQVIGHSLDQESNKGHLFIDLKNDSTRSIYARVRLECTIPSAEPVILSNRSIRVYHEAKNVTRKVSLNGIPLDRCQSLKVSLLGLDDPEYENKIIDEFMANI